MATPVELTFEAYAKTRKPVATVFQGVYLPENLSGYFITDGASGRLDKGATITWEFHHYLGAFPLIAKDSVEHQRIGLEWDNPRRFTQVEIAFGALDEVSTKVETKNQVGKSSKFSNASYRDCMEWHASAALLESPSGKWPECKNGFAPTTRLRFWAAKKSRLCALPSWQTKLGKWQPK